MSVVYWKVAGFPVFGCGQPSADAAREIVQRAAAGRPAGARVFWFTMRQVFGRGGEYVET